MKRAELNLGLSILAVLLTVGQSTAVPQSTAFTYQGQLKQAGVPLMALTTSYSGCSTRRVGRHRSAKMW